MGAFGLWIEKGEIAFPVAEITISGNLGDDPARASRWWATTSRCATRVCAPTIKFAGITVGGKKG